MRDCVRLRPLVVVGAVLLTGAFLTSSPSVAQSPGAQAESSLIGVWQLDLARSKYSPGPAPASVRPRPLSGFAKAPISWRWRDCYAITHTK